MSITDIIIYVSIAIVYNLFVHNFASSSYKDYQYEEKHQNTIIMIVLFGAIGIIVAKIMEKNLKNNKNNKRKTSNISNGLYYGGIFLLLTALIANWDSVVEETKMFIAAGVLGCLIWYGYQKENAP